MRSHLLAAAVLVAGLPLAAQPCLSERVSPGSVFDVNGDLKEYGWIFEDALSASCAPAAAKALARKLAGTRSFDGWLEGVHLEMAHASALVLGGRGLLTPRLDALVRRAQRRYRYVRDPWCDPHSTINTCFDDQGQAAAAWAWMGAYEKLAGRTRASARDFQKSESVIREALAPANFLCVVEEVPAPCRDPLEGRVVVFNHGFEDLGYGIGMVTSFSSALAAFDVAGRSFELSSSEKAVLRALFLEGQRGALPDGSAFRGHACLEVKDGKVDAGHDCADHGYRPTMFPVRVFYEKRVGVPNEDPYRYDLFDASLFTPGDDFLHLGRKAIYGALARDWWDPGKRPPLAAKVRPRRPSSSGVPSARPGASRPAPAAKGTPTPVP